MFYLNPQFSIARLKNGTVLYDRKAGEFIFKLARNFLINFVTDKTFRC